MPCVIKIESDALGLRCPETGLYIRAFDAEYADGIGCVWSTGDKTKAKTFRSALDAMEFWSATSMVRPLRDDGKPNRPLTAFTVSIEALPGEGGAEDRPVEHVRQK